MSRLHAPLRFAGALSLLVIALSGMGTARTTASGNGCDTNFGAKIPVLLVHGFHEGPAVWTSGSPSMAQAISKVPGVSVVTPFNYYSTAAQATDWVTDPQIGAKLASDISCLAKASKAQGGAGKVIIVAHSMGGLAVRCAVSVTCVNRVNTGAARAAARPSEIGLVITLGTPNTGSWLANMGQALAYQGSTIARMIANALCANPACKDLQKAGGTAAAVAMRIGSPELASAKPGPVDPNILPPLPQRIPLYAIAGEIIPDAKGQVFGWSYDVPMPDLGKVIGDAVVPVDSALAEAPPNAPPSGSHIISCSFPFNSADLQKKSSALSKSVQQVQRCFHLKETFDATWQAAVVADIKAGATALTAAPCTPVALTKAINSANAVPSGNWQLGSYACQDGYSFVTILPYQGMEVVAILQQQTGSWKIIYGPNEGLCLTEPLPSFCQGSALPLPWPLLRSLMHQASPAATPEFYVHNGFELGSLYSSPNFPATINLNNGASITGLQWGQVSASSASATGTLNVDNCTPSCASGTNVQYQVRLLASDPQQCTVAVYQPGSATSQQVQADVFDQIQVTALSGSPPAGYTGQSPPDLPPACN